jgi:hypothetical protein
MAYFINPSHQSVCLYAYLPIVVRHRLGKNPPIFARQRLGEKVTAAKNTHVTMKEFLDESFYMLSVSYQRKGGD